jgi:WD40 repeat protein
MQTGGQNSPTYGSEDGIETGVATAVNPIGLPLSELKKLKERFMSDGEKLKLSEDQFIDALSKHQPHAETQAQRDQWHSELCTLFKKIDARDSRTVDWEEFTNYMLNHMPGYNTTELPGELSQNPMVGENFAASWSSGHTDMINDICVVSDIGVAGGGAGANLGSGIGQRRYVTVGRDGYVKVWLPDLRLHREIDVGQHRSWLAACCWMPSKRRLAVASSRFKVYFYDGAFSGQPLSYIDHKDGTPLCLGHTQATESDGREREILMVGDNNGCVTVYPLDDDWTEQFADREMSFKTKPSRRQYHSDWVTKVGFVTELQSMVTCGLDGEINLCDVHMNQRKEGREAITVHKKGVHCWCWCASYKFFASGGLDRQIVIWNPYTQRSITSLQGHNASIMDVLVNEAQHQLVSLSVDKVVKVWDIRNYRCIQTFTDKTEYKPEDRLTCMAFDPDGPALVLCSSTLNVLPVNVKVDTTRTHLAPIIGALYNETFHQIVSGDSGGTICVWDVRSGNLEFDFKVTSQDHKLTCMAFDTTDRLLYTGGEDGVVKAWNFSSGEDLQKFTMPRPYEITGLLWAKEGTNIFIVGLAWDRRIYVWPDQKKLNVSAQYILEDNTGNGHTDDVSCICRYSTKNGYLATGGDDGYINFWRIQENFSSAANSRKYRLEDTTPATPVPGGEPQKLGGRDTKATRRKKKGFSLAGQDSDTAAVAAAAVGEEKLTDRSKFRSSIGQFADPPQLPTASAQKEQSGAGDGRGEPENWPEELGLEEFDDHRRTDGVERMIYLEYKDIFISSHADNIVRAWSRQKAEFIERLQLLARAPETRDGNAKGSAAEFEEGAYPRGKGTAAARDRGGSDDTSSTNPVSEEDCLVSAQTSAITALYSDSDNRWLFTGDAEGWVRLWDLIRYYPGRKYLMRYFELQPHRQPVTQLQYFELDGENVIMSASADGTIALCTIEGDRIGTFSN